MNYSQNKLDLNIKLDQLEGETYFHLTNLDVSLFFIYVSILLRIMATYLFGIKFILRHEVVYKRI